MSKILRFVATVPGTDTVAYATGDAFGTNIAITLPERGRVVNVLLTDQPSAAVTVDMVLARGTITATNNAALDITDAQLDTVLGVVSLSTVFAFADNGVLQPPATFTGISYGDEGSAAVIQLVARGVITLAAGDVPQLTVYVEV